MIDIVIERLMPSFLLADRNGYAMAKAMEAGLNMMCGMIRDGVDTVLDVDKMPEWRLDEMAWELNIEWYEWTADVDIKRAQIKGAYEYYNRLGTRLAVKRAVGDVYGSGQVEEWFEYGGEPFTFRVYTSDTQAQSEKRDKFLALLNIVKNARSVLDGVFYSGAEGAALLYTATKVVGTSISAGATAVDYGT